MKALFLGDSITEGFDLDAFFPGRNFENYGISGFSSAELLDVTQPTWFRNQPEVVFLCIGTNDLARCIDEREILKNIRQLIRKIIEYSPIKPVIYLTSLFPTRHNPPRPNPVIDLFNIQLHTFAVETGIQYLHLNPFFKDENSQLKRSFTNDGLHLNAEAYQKWTNILLSFMND